MGWGGGGGWGGGQVFKPSTSNDIFRAAMYPIYTNSTEAFNDGINIHESQTMHAFRIPFFKMK